MRPRLLLAKDDVQAWGDCPREGARACGSGLPALLLLSPPAGSSSTYPAGAFLHFLAQREFLERDPDNQGTYKYMA